MEKYLATQNRKTAVCPISEEVCETACRSCNDCKPESRSWSDCWSACDECNRCLARKIRSDIYLDPYNYMPWWHNKSVSNTPIAKQFCDNICGVNMCRRYRRRKEGYEQCLRCKQRGQCWSEYQSRCVQCPESQRGRSCEMKWGCPNPFGGEFGYVGPIDPMYTECRPCWNELNYTT